MMLDTYSHIVARLQEAAAVQFDEMIITQRLSEIVS
jgi:hypothetical protein